MASALFSGEDFSSTKAVLSYLYPLFFVGMFVLPKRVPGVKFVGDVSKKYPTVLDPALYTFAIWAPIYLGQLAFVMYQLLPQANEGLVFGRVGPWLLGVYSFSTLWTITYGREQLKLSAVMMIVFFGCLAVIYTRINTVDGLFLGNTGEIAKTRTWAEYLCVYLPFSMYASWMLAANAISAFVASGFPAEKCQLAGMGMLVVAAAAAVGVLLWTRDVAFACVNIWALMGIWVGRGHKIPGISPVALFCAAVVGVFTAYTILS